MKCNLIVAEKLVKEMEIILAASANPVDTHVHEELFEKIEELKLRLSECQCQDSMQVYKDALELAALVITAATNLYSMFE